LNAWQRAPFTGQAPDFFWLEGASPQAQGARVSNLLHGILYSWC